MRILSIETSCDETAVSIVQTDGDFPHAKYTVLGDALFSQIDMHREYGGVFPTVAKREHIKTLVPMLTKAITDGGDATVGEAISKTQREHLNALLHREAGLAEALSTFHEKYGTQDIDIIAVTHGPGLEPALWVGVNFAKALSYLWDVPIIGTDHMEGHILSSLFDGTSLADIAFPALAVLISGGHTELILMQEWGHYEKIGQTRDDAVGEAFDKVARMLDLPYPGGPEISKKAEWARTQNLLSTAPLPRPMLTSNDLDFSFSGLKTAVLYALKKKDYSDDERAALCREFEDAVTEVLVAKTRAATEEYGAQTVILGGGVSANTHIRNTFTESLSTDTALYIPNPELSTDNAVMIALAAHTQYALNGEKAYADPATLAANGNLSLDA